MTTNFSVPFGCPINTVTARTKVLSRNKKKKCQVTPFRWKIRRFRRVERVVRRRVSRAFARARFCKLRARRGRRSRHRKCLRLTHSVFLRANRIERLTVCDNIRSPATLLGTPC